VLRLGGWAVFAALAVGSQGGCTREFYREWANQDVSEAIFEKSRDPRWRLDTFSIEAPALSRFADPYDQDAPPAPPDDVATEALSPTPQWPSNRLIVPVEGTGYMELLEYWQRQDMAADAAAGKPPVVRPANSPLAGLPDNLGAGGFPLSLSTDPASRQGIPFEPFPGMANPFVPGAIIGGGATEDNQPPGATAEPIAPTPREPALEVPGSGYPGAAPRPNGAAGAGGTAPPGPPPSLPPTSPSNAPPAAAPRSPQGLPNNTGPTGNAMGPSASAGGRRFAPGDLIIPIVRLQDGPSTSSDSAARTSGPILGRTFTNSGTKAPTSTPISVSRGATKEARPYIPPPRPPASRVGAQTTGPRGGKDRMLARVAFQDESVSGGAAPPAGRQAQPGGQPAPGGANMPGAATPGAVPQPPPLPPASPAQPVRRPGTLDPIPEPQPLDSRTIDEVGRMRPAEAVGLAGILVPIIPAMNESEAAGLPKDMRAYRLNMQQTLVLALINGRYYQFQLEALYEAALPVTLQRFAFEPQFYAGMSPTTGVPQTFGAGSGGASFAPATGLTTANAFTYSTRFAPTGQVSTMNLGTVAGFGKLFSSGSQLLMGFANELVFNFAGKNPRQPTVLSALPMSFYQPLLRGAGRAVTLEPLTTDERALLYQVRAFTQFRQQYIVVTLTGGTVQNFGNTFALSGFTSSGNTDPVIGFIPAAFNVVQVEIDRRNVAFYDNLVTLYRELIKGESSGLSQLQVDQTMSQLIGARLTLWQDKATYRWQLDQFKTQLGMPPDTPIVMDQSFLGTPFYNVFDAVDGWQRRPERNLNELPGIIGQLPQLPDIDMDGRSVLGIYRNYRASAGANYVAEDEDGLEDLLQAAVRIGLEYRLDLMNTRAQLYDAWRQIRVTANALKGVLNVTLTNNIYTGPYTTNPFAFLSQAKNFSLVLQTELPLVRVNERNNFRTAMINYQRARRSLMNAEDALKVQLRQDLRFVQLWYITYEINKRNYELNVRLKDQAFEQIVAPPQGGAQGQGLAQSANAATQTTNLLNFQRAVYGSQTGLIGAFENYQQYRLIFYRDIGTLPYDEWEAFRELFPAQYNGPIFGHDAGRTGPAAGAEAPAPPTFGR
jgi:hypothetical protein